MSIIRNVETIPVTYQEPNDAKSLRSLLFVRLETDDGVVGWGEGITQFPASTLATAVLVEDMKELLIGQSPIDNIRIFRQLQSKAWWYGYRGGLFNFALSAVDIALWDLRGQVTGQSLSSMIGRRTDLVGESLPALASTHVYQANLDEEVARHAKYVREGFVGVKIGMGKKGDARIGYEIDRDIAFVRALREACGPDAWIMMDRGQSLVWTLDEAIRRVRAWEEFDLKWVEEPFEPWEHENLRKLRLTTSCLIAGAEREWDARGYQEVLSTGLLDVVGCDVGRVGGITGALSVIQLVEANSVWFNSHAWSSAVNTAASIALSASTSRCLVQELKPDPSPMQHHIVLSPFEAIDGRIAVPNRPGLGVQVDEKALRSYRINN